MLTTHRNYREKDGDFDLIANFIMDNTTFVRSHSTWCLGRFVDWRYSIWPHKLAELDFWGRNAHLWFDGFGSLVGFVISEEGGAEFTIITQEGYRLLFEEMLEWTMKTWGDRQGALNIEVSEAQVYEIAILEKLGFHQDSTFFTSAFDLTGDLVPQRELPEGFTISDLEETPDPLRQARLRADAFGSGEADKTAEALAARVVLYDYTATNPTYHAKTDMVVIAPNGAFAAGCEALINARGGEVDIERVCTHSDYRRRGLARAVIIANMHRLKALGYKRAYIAGYSDAAIALYASLGHVSRRESYSYKLGE